MASVAAVGIWILVAIALVFGAAPVFLAWRFKRFLDRSLNEEPAPYCPKVSVILPCKGLDPGFDENIAALLEQDYPDFELIFVTVDQEDPAYSALERLLGCQPRIPCRLVTAGRAEHRSQKLNNQLRALDEVRTDSEVLVFVDSDIRPHPRFLRFLVAPLGNPEVGATTGFRWYLPVTNPRWAVLRSVWNGGAVPLLPNQGHNFLWGGAMAATKEVFERAEIHKHWEGALTDDFPMTLAIKAMGLRIEFVPQCLVASHEDSTFGEVVEFTNRQTIISRVYHPRLWWSITVSYVMANLLLLIGLALTVAYLASGTRALTPAPFMLLLVALEMLNARLLLPQVMRMLPQFADELRRLRWWYYLMTPAASVLILFNTLWSIFVNQITWRGVRYEVRSPTETVVLHEETGNRQLG